MNTVDTAVVSSFGTMLVLAILFVPLAFRKTKASPKIMKQCPACNKWGMA